jgi:TetR/AcrR family fatty acid metabolism transcriptional regulator
MENVDKRQAILQAAAKRFGSHGFHETKMEQIAEDAGVAKGTVYLYFKDKNNLLFEVARYYMQQHIESVRDAMAPYESAKDKLRAYARFHFARFPEMVKFNKLNFEHMLKLKKTEFAQAMRSDQRAFLDLIVETIRYGIERGELRDINPTDAALILTGALHAFVHAAIVGNVEPKAGPEADALVDLILQGLER